MASDAGSSREDDVVEGQACELGADLWTASDHRALTLVEMLTDEPLEKRRDLGNDLRGLDHGAVPGGKDPGQRQDRRVDREVPGAENAHDPFGLILDPRTGAEKVSGNITFRLSMRIHFLTLSRACWIPLITDITSDMRDWCRERLPKSR